MAARPIRTPSKIAKQNAASASHSQISPGSGESAGSSSSLRVWSDPALKLIDEVVNMDVDVVSFYLLQSQ